MKALSGPIERALAAAASLTGTRFGLLVASSVVATSAIVASALTGSGGTGALAAAFLGRERPAPPPAAPAPAKPSPAPAEANSPATPSPSPAPVSAPLAAPEAPSSTPSSEPARAPSEAPPPVEPTAEAGRVKHVFVISLATPGYEPVFGAASQMPYLAGTLRPQGELLSGYSLLGDAALPNQIAAISGQPPNARTREDCPAFSDFPAGAALDSRGLVDGDGCLYPVEALTLADQLTAGRLEWHGYIEGMVDEAGKPDNCVHPESDAVDEPALGGYAVQGNPFVYFHSLLDLGDCALNDVPLGKLAGDLGKIGSTPNYSLISPDLCGQGLPGQCPEGAPDGPASADAFLAEWVPKILASPAYMEDGLLIVSFSSLTEPAASEATPAPPSGKPQVGALLLSRFVSPGSVDPAPYDPYALLRTVEDLFGLDHLGLAAGGKARSFAPALLGESGGD